MPGGYCGRILYVDLTRRKLEPVPLDESLARKHLGGVGIATRIVWDETSATTEALSAENPLVFMVGPLTGTMVPTCTRHCVAGLSPLTDIWGTAYSGGIWAWEFKRSGFDGVVFRGKADKPVYLWLHNGEAELRDAGHVWGKDTYQTSDILQAETDSRASVTCIGQAGERQVRMASVMNDGRLGRAAARCGLGAVMGYKNLKAVVARGTMAPKVADPEGLKDSIERLMPAVKIDEAQWANEVRLSFRMKAQKWGLTPQRNWTVDPGPAAGDRKVDAYLEGKVYNCRGCRHGCRESRLLIPEDGYPESGTRRPVSECFAPLACFCGIDHRAERIAVREGYEMLQRYGVDGISAGAAICMAMECFEKGLITKADTDGVELRFGSVPAMLEMTRKLCLNEGFGEVLGRGVKRAAEQIGGLAPEYAIHCKGLAFPIHDPRTSNFMALEYATANKGADHTSARVSLNEAWVSPELGIPERQDSKEYRFRVEGQGLRVANAQNYKAIIDSLSMCDMMLGTQRSKQMLQPSAAMEWLNLATGWDMDLKEFLAVGERTHNLQRMINVRRGISRKDDILPPRILTLKRGGDNESSDHLPPIGPLLNEYYAYRGWSEEGVPTKAKMEELGLLELAKKGGFRYFF